MGNWQWKRFDSKEEAASFYKDNESVQKWLIKTSDKKRNRISAVSYHDGRNAVHGSLVICGDIEKPEDACIFHYYLTVETLITIGFDESDVVKDCEGSDEFFKRIATRSNPVEGFIQLASGIMEPFFSGMDDFEVKLHRMEMRMKDRNGGHLFHQVLELRYSLLYWTGLTRPIREIRYALDEAFHELLGKSPLSLTTTFPITAAMKL
ncbi:hypothetical protein VN24_03710 [Paenibacillus beijingensis]|uniref:Uncharacterized protein n=1 Tax=Paenibacillus beijingensis TaxID=1126833 RepID=A0A0D5NFF2_9BACL|nr:hypothetical protein VN24_03710 [Paenibacillus beijingensis]